MDENVSASMRPVPECVHLTVDLGIYPHALLATSKSELTSEVGVLGHESLLKTCDGGTCLRPDVRRIRKRFGDPVHHGDAAQLVSTNERPFIVNGKREVSTFWLILERNDRCAGNRGQDPRVKPADDGNRTTSKFPCRCACVGREHNVRGGI